MGALGGQRYLLQGQVQGATLSSRRQLHDGRGESIKQDKSQTQSEVSVVGSRDESMS